MLKLLLNYMTCIVACSGLATAVEADLPARESDNKPNVIFIKTDDQRFDSLSMTGHPVAKTPNIDQLATDGVFFNQAFITSPICGPSRANFFTGQWERRNRVGFPHVSGNFVSPDVFDNSWLMQLKRAGYFTGYIGKHHTNIGEIKQRNRYMKENLDFCYMKPGHLGFDLLTRKEFSNLKNSSQIEGLFEATEAFMRPGKDKDYFFANADASVKDFLSERDTSKPFCLSINFNLPHAASIGGMGKKPTDPEMYRTLYSDQKQKFEFPDGYPNIDVPLPKNVFRQDELMGYYRTTNQRVLLNKKIKMARAVTGIDLFVGNLRKQLAEMDLADNTILVFISDHGLLLGEHGLGGKTFLYEESIHVPLIVYSPFFGKSVQGKAIENLVVGQDVPATILELCGLDVPKSYQGRSLVPLIKDRPTNWRTEVFCENLFTDQGYPRMEAVRAKDWKYIRYFSKEHDRKRYLPESSLNGEQPIFEELFHLKVDPKEQINLANDPKHEQVLERFRIRCQKLVGEMGSQNDLSDSTGDENASATKDFYSKAQERKKTEPFAHGRSTTVLSRPQFSWDSIPLYMHVRKSAAFTPKELGYLAEFPLITLEKTTGSKTYGSTEDGSREAAKAIKAINKHACVLYYRNVMCNYSTYEVNESLKDIPNAFLQGKDGNKQLHQGQREIYDLSNPNIRKWWVDHCVEMAGYDEIDGIFLDGNIKALESGYLRREIGKDRKQKVAEGYELMMKDLKDRVRADKMLVANIIRARLTDSGLSYLKYFDGSYLEGIETPAGGLSRVEYLAKGIDAVQKAARQGKIICMSIGLGDASLTGLKIDDSRKKMAPGANIQPRFDYCLALFLVCAEKHSYFLPHDGYSVNKKDSSVWLKRFPEYDKPLGPPKGPAIQDGYTYSREFESASVFLNIETQIGKITWK